MALGNAVIGARRTPMTITWKDPDETVWNLTGCTITGVMKSTDDGTTARAIDGTLVLVGTGSTGQFTWTYGALDVSESGKFYVQFKATKSGQFDLTLSTTIDVKPLAASLPL